MYKYNIKKEKGKKQINSGKYKQNQNKEELKGKKRKRYKKGNYM